MKTSVRILPPIILLSLAALPLQADESATAPAPETSPQAEGASESGDSANPKDSGYDPDALPEQMQNVGAAYKQLRRAFRDSANIDQAAGLEAIQKMQLAFVQAKVLMPAKFQPLAGDAKIEAQAAYRVAMTFSIEALLRMERALLTNQFEDAALLMKDIKALQDEGHEKFSE